ncbi:sulfur reduction protein DsrE [Sulfuriferula sp. AH1]|uniref:DsrE family protein n=1 Tax=Sulfuriferula sp. AH1 TaxID=1985873 RepID=UPI000B3B8037|nr:DsrE family protein [Sulfuriferula sp. AH1]ARU30548.1 sulfur reduction protein DsrE [Sulfuriferula sp. AH1]
MADHHYLDNEEKSVIIVMTSGPSTPHRCATPFYIGAILASMEADVSIFFTMEAVKLAQKGIAENLAAMDGGKTIIEFIRDAKAAGVKLYLCKPAMPGYQLSESDIIDEVDEIANASKMADLILACDKSMFF